jgi:hypothetical protein
MAGVFVITLFGRKISRTLELISWLLVGFILVTMLIGVAILTPPSAWLDGLEGLFRPALPPEGTEATQIGAVAGFATMASGLNYVFMNYYRDKGYGMGSKTGYCSPETWSTRSTGRARRSGALWGVTPGASTTRSWSCSGS